MRVRYITIEREYGSGGTEIAEKTAAACGIRCYGPQILETVALRQNVSVEELRKYEESVSNSFLYSLFVMSQSQTGDPDLLSSEAKLYVAESRVIRELAGKGPAIFVGHSACQALQDQSGLLRVFIHGKDSLKKQRITESYGIPAEQADSVCQKFNRRRANYYHFCTRQKWNDPANYDVVLDSTTLGIEGCVRALTAIYQSDRAADQSY